MLLANWIRRCYRRANSRVLKRGNLITKLPRTQRRVYFGLSIAYILLALIIFLSSYFTLWFNEACLSVRMASALYIGLLFMYLLLYIIFPSYFFDRLLLRLVRRQRNG